MTSLQRPEWTPVLDYEPVQAIKSRRAILDRVATDRVLVMGYHFPFPAIGHVVRYDKAYRWEPVHGLGDYVEDNAMNASQEPYRVAVLDDYQDVALSMADWSALDGRATVTVFNDHLADAEAVVERLQPFDVVCVMRERTPLTRAIIERLPRLRLIVSTAFRNASIDVTSAGSAAFRSSTPAIRRRRLSR